MIPRTNISSMLSSHTLFLPLSVAFRDLGHIMALLLREWIGECALGLELLWGVFVFFLMG